MNETVKRDQARRSMIEVARGMLNGSVQLIDGCRKLVALRAKAALPPSAPFDVFRGVESETDDYPTGQRRQMYSPDLLERLERENARYLDQVRPALLDACREIIDEIELLRLRSDNRRPN